MLADMTADTPLILDTLRHFDIRVSRTELVDSEEDAVAFAGRRDAADARAVPIALFDVTAPRGETPVEGALDSESAIRSAYAKMTTHGALRFVAQTAERAGELLVIRGETHGSSGRTLALSHAAHRVERTVPLGSLGAEEMAANYEDYGHHGSHESRRRMLAHLLERVSSFFEGTGVKEFTLDVRLHENEYRVVDAASLPLPKRLHERVDHDRKGREYRPAGRQ
jgi:hypothetical protein